MAWHHNCPRHHHHHHLHHRQHHHHHQHQHQQHDDDDDDDDDEDDVDCLPTQHPCHNQVCYQFQLKGTCSQGRSHLSLV